MQLGGERVKAKVGGLVRLPCGIPHAYYNNGDAPTRALVWVSPAGELKELFDALHNLEDLDEGARLAAKHGVIFLPPEG